MKSIQKITVMMFALLLAVSAFAANKNSVDLTLNNQAYVNGATLAPGNYKVVLDRTGDSVQATFISNGKTVATSAGHFEQRTSFPASVALVVNNSDRAVQQILVQKMKGAVVLDAAGGATPSAASH